MWPIIRATPMPAFGASSHAVVVAAPPRRVAHDRLARDRVPGHALRVEGMSARDRHDSVDLVGVEDRPLERLHASERAAGHRREPLDPELVQERALGPHHVGDGDHGEVGAVRPARRRVERRRPRGPAAAAEQVRGDDEVPVGVERLAGADHPVPPAERLTGRAVAVVGPEAVAGALLRGLGREAGGVRVAAERVADEDHVVALRRQRAVGLVRDTDRVELPPAVEPHRVRQVEKLRLDGSDRAGASVALSRAYVISIPHDH